MRPWFDDQQIGVVRHDSQQDGVFDAIDLDRIGLLVGQGVRMQRISHQDSGNSSSSGPVLSAIARHSASERCMLGSATSMT